MSVLATPHPCLALSHVMSFLSIGRAAGERKSKKYRFVVLLSSADAQALEGKDVDASGVELLTYPGAFNRSQCLDFAAKYSDLSPIEVAMLYVDVGLKSCDALLSHEPLWGALRDREKDSAPFGAFFGDLGWPCSQIVADKLERVRRNSSGAIGSGDDNRPLPRLFFAGNIAIDPWCEHLGVPSPATEVPQLMGSAGMLLGPEPMSLPMRLLNVFLREVSRQTVNNIMLRPYTTLRTDMGIEPTSVFESLQSPGLVLIPMVWGVEPPRALPPSWKPIHPVLPSPPKPVSGEIGSFIESACIDGRRLVLIAFGTQAKLSKIQIMKITKAMSSLKDEFCFVWRLPSQANRKLGVSAEGNALAVDWLPQNDLLGHENTAAFVSHVGYGSLYEAAYHGVPIVGIPIFGDQEDNIFRAVLGGWGFRLDKSEFTADELATAILEAGRKGSSMRTRAREVSTLVRSKSGTEEAVEWMEYAVTHGVSHLMPNRAMKSSYVAYYNVDVGIILGVLALAMGYIVLRFLKRTCSKKRETIDKEKAKLS